MTDNPCSPLPRPPASPLRQISKTNRFPSYLSPVRHATPSKSRKTDPTALWSPRSPCIRINLSAQFDEADSDDCHDSTANDSVKMDSSTSSIDLSETFLCTTFDEGIGAGTVSVAGRARSTYRQSPRTTCPKSPVRAPQWSKRRLGVTRNRDRAAAAVVPAMNRLNRQNSLVSTKQLVAVGQASSIPPATSTNAPRWRPFDSFHDVRLIGSGAHCDVYEVTCDDGVQYAVKKSKLKLRGRRDRDLMLDEIRFYDILRAPLQATKSSKGTAASDVSYILTYHHAWQEHGYLYMQTELCPHGTLQDWTGRSIVSEAVCWRILHDVASGLACLHSRDIVHLDIKPANLLVTNTVIKIGDLGLAQFASSSGKADGGATNEGDSAYMAPELLNSTGRHPSADIFSLGLTLVELASGTALPSQGTLWHELRSGQLPTGMMPDNSSALTSLITRMLSVEPSQRPTAVDVLAHPNVDEANEDALMNLLLSKPKPATPPRRRQTSP